MIKFKFLTGDVNYLDYGGKWISTRHNNGEFDYWFVLELLNVEDCVGEKEAKEVGFKYWVSLYVVAPEEFVEKESAMESCGNELKWENLADEQKVELIQEYSGGARIFHAAGNNYMKLVKEAKKEADITASFTFGFKMDSAQNAIGSTGWDFLRGDVLGGLKRYVESGKTGDTKMDLMAKIQGV